MHNVLNTNAISPREIAVVKGMYHFCLILGVVVFWSGVYAYSGFLQLLLRLPERVLSSHTSQAVS